MTTPTKPDRIEVRRLSAATHLVYAAIASDLFSAPTAVRTVVWAVALAMLTFAVATIITNRHRTFAANQHTAAAAARARRFQAHATVQRV